MVATLVTRWQRLILSSSFLSLLERGRWWLGCSGREVVRGRVVVGAMGSGGRRGAIARRWRATMREGRRSVI